MERPYFANLAFWCAYFVVLIFMTLAGTVRASGLRIENVRFIAPRETPGELRVVFDLSWQNAWRHTRNHDAAWVFLKFVFPEGGYTHVKLAPDGHRVVEFPGSKAPPGRIDVADDQTGFFIYADTLYRGDVLWRISVRLDADAVGERLQAARLAVYGIEMVYISEGPFTLGDPDTTALDFGAFYRAGTDGEPDGLFRITSEAEIPVGPAARALYYREGQYQGDRRGLVSALFPKGFRAFYVMKYEITQGQYADFLNTLPDEATYERFPFGGRSYFTKRGSIRREGQTYQAGHPKRPLNFISWDDGLAFADWAALRPMTELEFTKASRGPESPRPGEFPWGTASRDQLARVVGPGGDLILANGWQEHQLTEGTRPVFGASYYWVMDLAGSVWERVITIGQPAGRAFTGSHGDGQLGDRGRATNEDWPHTYAGAEGHGYRGGGFYDQGRAVHEFNPHSPIAYRRFGAWSGHDPHRAYGFRCARTAGR